MSLQRYLLTMGLGTLISGVSWILVLVFLDPQTSGFIGLLLFFTSFFLAMFGLSSLGGYFARRMFQRQETPFRLVAVSFRQAGLFALLLTASLFLQTKRLFSWWTALALLAFVSLMEAFFVARQGVRESQRGGSHGA